MKKILSFLALTTIMLSCSNYSNIKKEDICGKRFTSSIPSPITQGVSDVTGTTLKCDGTFESGEVTRMTGQNTVDRNHFTGTWEIIKDIPEEVKSAVKKYGVDHTNYTIIKYTSSNGVTDYCIYYPLSTDNSPTLSPLNVSCDPDHAGIYGGFPEKN